QNRFLSAGPGTHARLNTQSQTHYPWVEERVGQQDAFRRGQVAAAEVVAAFTEDTQSHRQCRGPATVKGAADPGQGTVAQAMAAREIRQDPRGNGPFVLPPPGRIAPAPPCAEAGTHPGRQHVAEPERLENLPSAAVVRPGPARRLAPG